MSTEKNGGQAFPISREQEGWHHPGMSLRDWFAGRAMERVLLLSQDADGGWDPVAVAVGCYMLADAMIGQRSLPQEERHD